MTLKGNCLASGGFLMSAAKTYIDNIPDLTELRKKLAENLQERDLLKQLVKLAEQRDRLRLTEVSRDV